MPDRTQHTFDGWLPGPTTESPDDHATAHPPSSITRGGRDFRLIQSLRFGSYTFERRAHSNDDGSDCIHIFTVWKSRGKIPVEDRKELLPGDVVITDIYERYDITRSRNVRKNSDNPPDELYAVELRYCGDQPFTVTISDRDLEPSTRGPKWQRLTRMSRYYTSTRSREKYAAIIRAAVAYARQDGMTTRYLFTQTGPVIWNGIPMFLTPTGAFTPDGWTEDYRADMTPFADTEGVASLGYREPDPRTVRAGLRELLNTLTVVPDNPAEIGAFMACQILASVAGLYPWGRLAVMVAGGQGQGKTTLARMFLANQSATARGMSLPVTIHIRNVLSSFNGALMDLEALGGHAAVVDDVQTSESKHASRAATFVSAIVAALYDGPGSKQTWGNDGPAKAKTYAPNGNVILTTERPPRDEPGSSSESTRARMIIVWHQPNSIDVTARARYQSAESEELRYNASCYAVQWIYSHLDRVEELYRQADKIVGEWGDYPSDHLRERYVRAVAGNLILGAVCQSKNVKFREYRDRVIPALKTAYDQQLANETPQGSEAAHTDIVAGLRETLPVMMVNGRFVFYRLHKQGNRYQAPERHPEISYALMGWAEQNGVPWFQPERMKPLGEVRDPECPGRDLRIGNRTVQWAVRFQPRDWAVFHNALSETAKRHGWHVGTREEIWECALADHAGTHAKVRGTRYLVFDLEWLYGVGQWADHDETEIPDASDVFAIDDMPGRDDVVLVDEEGDN